ncbi:DNA alkylation repair protein [Pedobacter deserti]|uniref:DNA alkylation repair protein n=1 Tax=Pedobacter deserti TaxID=2817382 RepID=UPI002108E513|nr:DNA alkylation repair protein [Pedobacter sp. SYSU D00382]
MSSSTAAQILAQISKKDTKLGELRKIAKEIKKDHGLAMELWGSGSFLARQLAILIMDSKLLSQQAINQLDKDMQCHSQQEKSQLLDWLMANQLSKDRKTIALMQAWSDSPSALQRRAYWYYQARLRWVGQTPPPNTEELLQVIEKRIEEESPEVQWAMNFTAGQIGVFQPEYRDRCIALGERTGLYKDEMVAKNCTPSYLPKFIAVQAAKLEK